MNIRRAIDSDLDDLVLLNDQIQRLHAEQYPDEFRYPTDPGDVRDFFIGLLNSEHNIVVVACEENRTVGYLYYEVHRIPQDTFKFAIIRYYIHHVLVDEYARRLGTASALFDWVEKEARDDGVSQIALDTWMRNADAHKFFKRKGYQLTQLLFSKPLELRQRAHLSHPMPAHEAGFPQSKHPGGTEKVPGPARSSPPAACASS